MLRILRRSENPRSPIKELAFDELMVRIPGKEGSQIHAVHHHSDNDSRKTGKPKCIAVRNILPQREGTDRILLPQSARAH